MKKRTMQEWADFLGCYVAKDEDGEVCIHTKKPITHLVENEGWWGCAGESYRLSFFSKDTFENVSITIKDADIYDWRVLVEPKEQKNDGDVNGGLTNWIKRMRAAQRQYERTNDENARREKERCESAVDVFLKDLKEVEE